MDKNESDKTSIKFSGYQRRLKNRREIIKSFKARLDAKRSIAERIADFMTSKFGSIVFLGINTIWFVVWIIINTGFVPIIEPFDPFPFGLLTMIVSLEAIILAIFVLISQNRAAKVDDLREEITLHIDVIAEEEITKMMELQVMLLKKSGVDLSGDEELHEMLEPTDTDRIAKILETQLDKT
jgi:uncharacterized membrane protein